VQKKRKKRTRQKPKNSGFGLASCPAKNLSPGTAPSKVERRRDVHQKIFKSQKRFYFNTEGSESREEKRRWKDNRESLWEVLLDLLHKTWNHDGKKGKKSVPRKRERQNSKSKSKQQVLHIKKAACKKEEKDNSKANGLPHRKAGPARKRKKDESRATGVQRRKGGPQERGKRHQSRRCSTSSQKGAMTLAFFSLRVSPHTCPLLEWEHTTNARTDRQRTRRGQKERKKTVHRKRTQRLKKEEWTRGRRRWGWGGGGGGGGGGGVKEFWGKEESESEERKKRLRREKKKQCATRIAEETPKK
jgi:hypothetical protein